MSTEFENKEAQAETLIAEFKEAVGKLFKLQIEVDDIIILLFLFADEQGDYMSVDDDRMNLVSSYLERHLKWVVARRLYDYDKSEEVLPDA